MKHFAKILQVKQDWDAEERWHSICDIVFKEAVATNGKWEWKNADWSETHITKMEPVINAKCAALMQYKKNPTKEILLAPLATCNKAQQTAHHCANNYWWSTCSIMQTASDRGRARSKGHVWGNQAGYRCISKENSTSKNQGWRGYNCPQKVDWEMGWTLPGLVLQWKLCIPLGTWCHSRPFYPFCMN